MFVVIWLLLLAAVETAFVIGDVEANETAKILPNRMVDDGIFQLGVTKVASVPNIQKRQSKSNLANPYIGDIYMITSMPLQKYTISCLLIISSTNRVPCSINNPKYRYRE